MNSLGIMIRAEILDAARSMVTEQKEREHGTPSETFRKVALLWESYLDVPITMTDVAWMLTLLKIARAQQNSGNEDNFVDAAGYAALAAELAREHE